MNDLITRPEVRELTEETSQILTGALTFKIQTNVSYQLAADELMRIKGAAKKLETLRKSITQPMDAAKAVVMDFFRAPAEQLAQAETQIKAEMGAYQAELNRKAEAARKEAERLAAEERERLALAAAKAAEEGRHDDAVAIAESVADVVTLPAVTRSAPAVKGISVSKVWKCEVTDPKAVPREYCIPDETKIRKMVQVCKGEVEIAGVRIWAEDQISSRAS